LKQETLELTFKTLRTKTGGEHTSTLSCKKVKRHYVIRDTYSVLWQSQHTWAVQKVSVNCEYLENRSHGLDVTW